MGHGGEVGMVVGTVSVGDGVGLSYRGSRGVRGRGGIGVWVRNVFAEEEDGGGIDTGDGGGSGARRKKGSGGWFSEAVLGERHPVSIRGGVEQQDWPRQSSLAGENSRWVSGCCGLQWFGLEWQAMEGSHGGSIWRVI